MDVFRTFICPDASVVDARAICSGMFTTPLSSDGSLPATHWISSGALDEALADQIAAVVDMDTSEENPFDAMVRLGLVMVQESL
jgi:hypothetical protein